jgi:hypothetical protein
MNAPAAFIHPCQPIVAKRAPTGPGWGHELKHDGYQLQIAVTDNQSVREICSTVPERGHRSYPLAGRR